MNCFSRSNSCNGLTPWELDIVGEAMELVYQSSHNITPETVHQHLMYSMDNCDFTVATVARAIDTINQQESEM